MQADHEHGRPDPGDEFDQLGGLIEIGGQIQENQIGTELPQADIERLHRRVSLHFGQNVERARYRQRGGELLGQLSIGRDHQRSQLGLWLHGPRFHVYGFASGIPIRLWLRIPVF